MYPHVIEDDGMKLFILTDIQYFGRVFGESAAGMSSIECADTGEKV